jgi:DNA processing protein
MSSYPTACEGCLVRPWLLARLSGHLDRARARIEALLALGDDDLIAAVAGRERDAVLGERERFDPAGARERIVAAGLEAVCRCHPGFPARLRALEAPPAVLHVAGGWRRWCDALAEPVAIVGTRHGSDHGLGVAHALGRGLGAAGLAVVSGLALGIDSAAHEGTLAGGGVTVAVLPGGADRTYPASHRGLHRRIVAAGCTVSELPPGTVARRWSFPARNRLIAGLAAMTIVVEASGRSGSLLTARQAAALGRPVGAVPGRVGTLQAEGPNALLADGARVVRDAQDVLDDLFGVGVRTAAPARRAPPNEDAARLLEAVAAGHDTIGALLAAGIGAEQALPALAALELSGHLRRGVGGRFVVVG